MAGRGFDISRINSFAVLLMSLFFVSIYSVNALDATGSLVCYTPLELLLDGFVAQNPTICLVANGVMVLLGAMTLSKIGIGQQVFLNRSYLAAIFFVIVAMSISSGAYLFRVYLSSFALILAISHLFKGKNAKRVMGYRWMACGFWLAISSMLYTPAILGILVILIGMMIFRMNAPREYVIALSGFLMVGVINWSIYIILGFNALSIFDGLSDFIVIPQIPMFTINEWLMVGSTTILTVLGIVFLVITSIRGRSDMLKGAIFFTVLLILGGGMSLFTPLAAVENMPILSVVISMVMSIYFTTPFRQPYIKHLVFTIFLAIGILVIL